MKKLLLVVGYKTINYGSVLQAYATQKMFEKAGASAEVLNMEMLWFSTRKKRVMFYLKNAEVMELIHRKGGVYFSKIMGRFHKDYRNRLRQRHGKFDAYVRENLTLTAEVKSWDEASELAEKYDAAVIGSDQVWLPSGVMTDIYTLAFVSDGQTRIAYAPSFGISTIPRKYWSKYREMLERFQFLSVREDTGVKIVKEIAGLECGVVADPVYMLDRDEWLKEIPDNVLYEEPYIFVYLLGNNRWQREVIARYAGSCGIKTVAVIHLDQYIGYDERCYDVKLTDAAPCDFLNLIRHAELIFTDSFHCVSFSLIENKEFYAFRRYAEHVKGSTNSRMDSLFHMLHIDESRMLDKASDMTDIGRKKLDYREINCLLDRMCRSSWEFVNRVIDND